MPAEAIATPKEQADQPKSGLKNWHLLLASGVFTLLLVTNPTERWHREAYVAELCTDETLAAANDLLTSANGSESSKRQLREVLRSTAEDYLEYHSFGFFSYTRYTEQGAGNRVKSFGLLGKVFAWP